VLALACAAVLPALAPAAAPAAFPYGGGGTPASPTYRTVAGQVPDDLDGGDNDFKYAGSPEANNLPANALRSELCGVRGASVVDDNATFAFPPCPPDAGGTRPIDTAWQITTGRPDVAIAVLDSGIKWNDRNAMRDLAEKTRLNRGELPTPNHLRTSPLAVDSAPTPVCPGYANADDANRDGIFNITDFACDTRVEQSPAARGGVGVGPADLLDPQDVLIAFSGDGDNDGNGFADDIAGWDFMDNDNDAYDDVQYGHGTGEARGSTAEADDNNGEAGSCPNCMSIPMRVGDSFVADINRFAQAVIYAVDNDALVVQEALGALNNSKLARDAVDYAYKHGVTIIASAADEAAQHHHWPEAYPHVIVVNSVTGNEPFQPKSYLAFNGCTNFSSKITIAIPSNSCSSDAVGVASGLAGLAYSAALNARAAGDLANHPSCQREDGSPCVLSANEVRQLMASGSIGSQTVVDDVNFASPNGEVEPSCSPTPTAQCTDPNVETQALVDAHRLPLPLTLATRSYPARKGHDQFYGWGRVNMWRTTDAIRDGAVPPEVEITSPNWFAQVDPGQGNAAVEGQVNARGASYTCQILVAPGSYPHNGAAPVGDFSPVASPGVCDGTQRTAPVNGVLGQIDVAALKSRFPAATGGFDGPESGVTGLQTANGRPNVEPFGFVVKVVATTVSSPRTGEDRRNLYLHRDQDLLPGWPKQLQGDGESSPLFVDLDGDNRTELLMATADGIVHAFRRDGSELPGWPASGDALPLHTGGQAFQDGAASPSAGGAFLASLAAADLQRDGIPEVVGADFEGKVYVWSAAGDRVRTLEATPAYSGKPLTPFADVRLGKRYRTQHGFIGSPVLADLDTNDGGRLEIVAAGMDRHVYAWNDDGSVVPGYPVLVADRDKLTAINSVTHAPTFGAAAGDELNQGAIIDTPAVGDITGDGKPEIVVGTNEEYRINTGNEGDFNVGNFSIGTVSPVIAAAGLDLGDANGRLYAIEAGGEPGGPSIASDPYAPGWPVPVGRLMSELLPIVGEGITGAPVIGPKISCDGSERLVVGAIPDAGPGLLLDGAGSSCLGETDGKPNGFVTENENGTDRPAIPAVGHPAFGKLDAAGDDVAFLAPAAGLLRAADLALPEYQTGSSDYLGAWDTTSGQFRAGFPARTNDLSFLTGPSIADIDGLPGEEAVAGTAYLDLQAFNAAGAPVSPLRWPKLTSDWMVANPAIGAFGTLDTDPAARKTVVANTRDGRVFVYATDAQACSPGSWPRFHHDNANSGAYERDAVAPGVPTVAAVNGTALTFKAPGDDLLCDTVTSYEVVQSDAPITAADFAGAVVITPILAAAPGATQALTLPEGARTATWLRAVDEQGNVGRFAEVVTATGGPGTPGDPGPGAGAPGGTAPPAGPGTQRSCRDALAPLSRLSRRGVRASRRGLGLRGTSRDVGCLPRGERARGRIRRVEVAIGRIVPRGCRFLLARGFGGRRPCARAIFVRAAIRETRTAGTYTWALTRRVALPPGRYVVTVRAVDRRGNLERGRIATRRVGLRVR